MKILTSHPLSVAPIAGRIPFPGHSVTLVAKGLFRLDEGRVRELLEGEELSFPTGDIPAGEDEDEAGEIRYANDFAFYKPRTDLILVGRCHPPGDEAVGSCRVGFQVGDHARSLQVFGDRWWAGEGVGHRMTEPHPFTEMELSWERAYGGVESPDNPVGRGDRPITLEDGRQAWPLPNIESPRQLVQSPDERPTPAGFGPIPLTWEPRRSRSGTYDDAWLESRWPWFPEDLDWSLFNAAAPDMQHEGFLRGDEEVHLENLRPGEPDFRTRLPGLRVRCFLNVLPEDVDAPPSTEKARQDWTPPPREEMEFREVPVNLDTLWVDAEEGLLALVWRGYTPVRTEEFDEVRHLYLHVEALEDDPADLDACRAAFWALLDEEEGEAADEPDLIDALAEPEGPDPASDPAEEEPEDEDDLEIDLPFDPMEKLRADMEAMGIDPDNPPEPTPEEREAAKEYFRAEGRDDLVALLEMSEEDEEDEEEAPPPPWSRERVVELHAQGEPLEDADLRGLDLSGLELPGLEALEADFTGANLSGTDLSDAQLSAATLSGADLSGVRLQGATLAGCDLTEARMSEAVLIEADLSGSRLDKADLRGADLTDALLDDCRMTGADLTGAEAADAVFTGADLSDALLLRGNFKGADFTGAIMDRVDAREAVFESAEFGQVSAVEGMFASADMTELRAADALDFTGANLSQVQARESVWSGATLERAVLAWAMLEGADFTGANLRGADFYAAHLKGARFAKADLLDARLATADAFEASFEKADLARADLRGGNFYGAEFLDARFWETATEGANFRMTKYG